MWQGGNGPPLLLIHGVGLRAEAWGPMLPHLTTHFSVTAVDLPGHGDSDPLDSQPTLADYTNRIAQILTRPMFVAGHSMGALIAMDLALRYPKMVTAIAPLNAIFRRSTTARRAVQARAAELAQARPDPAPTLARWFGAAPAGALATARDDCRTWLTSVDAKGYHQAYTVFAHEDGPPDAALATLPCPALFITGADEPNSTPAMSQALAAAVPQGCAEIVRGARHMMPMTHAKQVSDLLIRFHNSTPDRR